MIEIKIPQMSYNGCTILDGEPDYVALHTSHMEFKWKYSARILTDDEAGIEKEFKFNGIATIPKDKISYTEAGYTHDKNVYQVLVRSTGGELVLDVDSMKLARAIHKQIVDWLYEKPQSEKLV